MALVIRSVRTLHQSVMGTLSNAVTGFVIPTEKRYNPGSVVIIGSHYKFIKAKISFQVI